MASGGVLISPVVRQNADSGGMAGAVGQVKVLDLRHEVQIAGCHPLLPLRDSAHSEKRQEKADTLLFIYSSS